MKRVLATVATLLLGVAICVGQNIPTIHNEDIESSIEYRAGNNFQKDLLLYVDMLKATHPYYANAKHQAQLDKQIKRMYRECGGLIRDVDFKVYLAKIAARLKDGHTSVPYWMGFNKIFPIKLMIEADASAIVEIAPEDRRELLGKTVKSINGKSIKQILKTARPMVSADNGANYQNSIKEFFMFAEFWPLIGMSNEVISLSFADGSSADILAIDKAELKIAQLQKEDNNRVTSQRGVLFDYTIFEEEGICYLQFNQFADRLTHPQYPQLARFDEFTRDMMSEIKAKGVQTLVIDLQYNGGGNSQLGDVLLSWLYPHWETQQYSVDVRISELLCAYYPYYRDFTVNGEPIQIGKLYDYMGFDHSKEYEIDYSAPQAPEKYQLNFDKEQIFGGNIIFVQGKNSFSSATLLLTLARDNGIGIIVGEPSGGKPSHYGDILYCTLPNTGTIATVSHKHFIRPNRKLADSESIIPDVAIDLNNPNQDLVWEWILTQYGKGTEQ